MIHPRPHEPHGFGQGRHDRVAPLEGQPVAQEDAIPTTLVVQAREVKVDCVDVAELDDNPVKRLGDIYTHALDAPEVAQHLVAPIAGCLQDPHSISPRPAITAKHSSIVSASVASKQ